MKMKVAYFIVISMFLMGQIICEPDINKNNNQVVEPSVLQKANVEFALDLLKKPDLCSWNCVFSPHSINSVLGLLLAGAKKGGETEKEILSALHLSGFTQKQVHQMHSDHLSEIKSVNSKKVQLSSANNIFINDLFSLSDEYAKLASKYYAAEPQPLSFNDPNFAANKVNEWVAQQTDNNIQDILSPGSVGPNTAAVLANAVYFYGEWANKFEKTETLPSKFFVDKHVNVEVDMMHIEDVFCHKKMTSPKFDVIELPYAGDDMSMVILKPYEPINQAISQVIAKDLLVNFLEYDKCEPISLYLPKFSIDLKVDLKTTLKALDVSRIFDPNFAELEGIVDSSSCSSKQCEALYVSQALHKAKIEVDEAGTTAAASTVVVVQFESAILNDVPEYRIDTPFFFMLYHKATKNVLFMGQVVNPVSQE